MFLKKEFRFQLHLQVNLRFFFDCPQQIWFLQHFFRWRIYDAFFGFVSARGFVLYS